MNVSFRQKINKETPALKDMLYQMNLTDTYRCSTQKQQNARLAFITCSGCIFTPFTERTILLVFFMYPSRVLCVYPKKWELYKYLYPPLLYTNSVLYTLRFNF